ncbi:MAG: hypothetical protein WCW66_04840 [Patescibacteria group bacterium]
MGNDSPFLVVGEDGVRKRLADLAGGEGSDHLTVRGADAGKAVHGNVNSFPAVVGNSDRQTSVFRNVSDSAQVVEGCNNTGRVNRHDDTSLSLG